MGLLDVDNSNCISMHDLAKFLYITSFRTALKRREFNAILQELHDFSRGTKRALPKTRQAFAQLCNCAPAAAVRALRKKHDDGYKKEIESLFDGGSVRYVSSEARRGEARGNTCLYRDGAATHRNNAHTRMPLCSFPHAWNSYLLQRCGLSFIGCTNGLAAIGCSVDGYFLSNKVIELKSVIPMFQTFGYILVLPQLAFVAGACIYIWVPEFRDAHALSEILLLLYWALLSAVAMHVREPVYAARDCRKALIRDVFVEQIW